MDHAIAPGDFYEDCRYHPVLCISAGDGDDDELVGISLINGSIGSCSRTHCGVERLNFDQALARKLWFNRLAARMGWTNPAPRDASADDLVDEKEIPIPPGWREMYDAGPGPED